MNFLIWVVFGLITGWFTGKLVSESGFGPIMNIVMGVAGALEGGFVASLASSPNYRGPIYTSSAAILGAATVTWISAHANARKSYA